ncbi:hypothetical protein [Neotabrizicola sp. sgz301269]|uniref:hypothetical protein n=1 Tax=Neotabrizicola sp. sgz301269 TaxID=3276282 RepID=UPI00377068E4
MTIAITNMISSAGELRRWAANARPRDFVTYHIGNVARDRAESQILHDLAELVLLLQETGFIIGSTKRVELAAVQGFVYFATRTGAGYAPHCIIRGTISCREFRALQAIRDRVGYSSAQRSVRDALSCADAEAADLLALLYARKWVEDAPEKGFQLSETGLAAML